MEKLEAHFDKASNEEVVAWFNFMATFYGALDANDSENPIVHLFGIIDEEMECRDLWERVNGPAQEVVGEMGAILADQLRGAVK